MQIESVSSRGDISNRKELGIDRPRVYYGWHEREVVLIGISYGGRTHRVEKKQKSGFWESIVTWQSDLGIAEKRDLVTKSSPIIGIAMDLLSRYLPGGEEYSRLRLATKDDFNGELE